MHSGWEDDMPDRRFDDEQPLAPARRRLLAIWNCAWYGVRPWWMYESVKHYRGTYLDHLRANVRYAWSFITSNDDEAEVNGTW